jgi:streptomycin 6-kinase
VLVHGDAHGANTLRVPGTSEYRFVDPDGLFAEPACDLAVPMREWSTELLGSGEPARAARERCVRLSALTGVASQPIWDGDSSSGSRPACSPFTPVGSGSAPRCSPSPSA